MPHRWIFIAFDVMKYRRALPSQQAAIQRDLNEVVNQAAQDARLPLGLWRRQPQGDALLIRAPLESEPRYIDDFVAHLQSALRRRNRDRVPGGRLRLRVGLAAGPSDEAATGYTGEAPILASSLRDASVTREALADSGADLVLAVSDPMFVDNVRQDHTRVTVDDFTRVRIDEAKISTTAWLWLPRGCHSQTLQRVAVGRASDSLSVPRADNNFPVLLELGLEAPRRRRFRAPQRDRGELPPQRPGTVLLFHDGREWTQAVGRVTGAEDFVVRAFAVSVVWTRPRDVDVDVVVPSRDGSDEFTVRATFRCVVTDAAAAAEEGPVDVVTRLETFLRRDPQLERIGAGHWIEDVNSVRKVMVDWARDYCARHAPDLPGLSVTLQAVQVLTPSGLLDHTSKLRDTRWARDLAERIGEHRDDDAKRLADSSNDPRLPTVFAQPEPARRGHALVTSSRAARA